MPWIKRSDREQAERLRRVQAEWVARYQTLGGTLRQRGALYSFLQIPCAPFEVFLQGRFGNGHLMLSTFAWGIVYPIWFFFFWQPDHPRDPWAFWPTAGVVVGALLWIHVCSGIHIFDDQYRIEGSGRSIPWALLMFLLSIVAPSIRPQLRYPLLRKKDYRFMDHAFKIVVHWLIAYFIVHYLIDTRSPPRWLEFCLVLALGYYAVRNFIMALMMAFHASGFKSLQELQDEGKMLSQQLVDQVDQERANAMAEMELKDAQEERRQGPERPSAAPARVVTKNRSTEQPVAANGASFCGECGKPLVGRKFCTHCGAAIG